MRFKTQLPPVALPRNPDPINPTGPTSRPPASVATPDESPNSMRPSQLRTILSGFSKAPERAKIFLPPDSRDGFYLALPEDAAQVVDEPTPPDDEITLDLGSTNKKPSVPEEPVPATLKSPTYPERKEET